MRNYSVLLGLLLCVFVVACQKNDISNDPNLQLTISTDSILFDTVFTTVGSTIEAFKIFNEHNNDIEISSLELAGGAPSNFRINLDGENGTVFSDYVVPANDSVYVFVEVTVDASQESLPFVIEDSVLFNYNGNEQKVILNAWGQNAHFHRNDTISDQQIWIDDLPHVIYGPLLIDEGASLLIDQGCNVYGHPNAGVFVKGDLTIQGTVDSLVTFDGDRLEDFFEDQPAQWNGIYVLRNPSGGATASIDYTVIDNTLYGVSVGSSDCVVENESDFASCFNADNAPYVQVNNSIIKNAFVSGLYGFIAQIEASNTLIYSCGKNNFEVLLSGLYDLKHCTFANYGSPTSSHKDAIVNIADFAVLEFPNTPGVNTLIQGEVAMTMENCIVMGSLGEEIILNEDNNSQYANVIFDHCLVRTERDQSESRFMNCGFNPIFSDSTFVDQWGLNYQLSRLSLAIDAGKQTDITLDINGIPRDDNPDIGCYEFVE